MFQQRFADWVHSLQQNKQQLADALHMHTRRWRAKCKTVLIGINQSDVRRALPNANKLFPIFHLNCVGIAGIFN